MIIKVLSLCASLLAPESSGLDPHGRSLHLPLKSDFNTSYVACIATVKQAQRLKVDPFVMAALMYRTTYFSPKIAKKSKLSISIREQYGCSDGGQFVKSSCSAFMLAPQYLRSLLDRTVSESSRGTDRIADYRIGLCEYIKGGERCTAAARKEAKIVENMAFRFMNMYGRTHTGYTWVSPFKPQRTPQELHRDDRRRERQLDRQYYGNPSNLNNMIYGLGYQPHMRNSNQSPVTTARAHKDLNLIAELMGPRIKVEMTEASQRTVNFHVHVPLARYMKEILWYINSNTSKVYEGSYHVGELKEFRNGVFKLVLKSRHYNMGPIILTFSPGRSMYQAMIIRR
jgi:hypothetical protein